MISFLQCPSLHCDEYFLPVKHKADDEPECNAPHRLGQPGGVRLHVVERPVEGGDHPANLVAAVEEDAVHPRIEERLTLPPVLQGTQASCEDRPSCPTSQPVSMPREHLEDIASLI